MGFPSISVIQSFTKSTYHFSNLEKLKLINANVTRIPTALNLLPNLRYLDISHSEIESLTNEGLINFEKMEEVDFGSMWTLTQIDDCAFCSFPNLKKVDISSNYNLQSIHANAFGNLDGRNLSSLEIFNADNCNLTMIPENLLDWNSIKEIQISQNPFICDCSMAWLINDFSNPIPQYVQKLHVYGYPDDKIICQGPEKFKDRTFKEISGKLNCEFTDSETSILMANLHTNAFSKQWSLILSWMVIIAVIGMVLLICYLLIRNRLTSRRRISLNVKGDEATKLFTK